MPRTKMDWLRLESRIRDALRAFNEDPDLAKASNYLFEISEILGDETGRGYEIDQDKIPLWNQSWTLLHEGPSGLEPDPLARFRDPLGLIHREQASGAPIAACSGCGEIEPLDPYLNLPNEQVVLYCLDCGDLALINWNGEGPYFYLGSL